MPSCPFFLFPLRAEHSRRLAAPSKRVRIHGPFARRSTISRPLKPRFHHTHPLLQRINHPAKPQHELLQLLDRPLIEQLLLLDLPKPLQSLLVRVTLRHARLLPRGYALPMIDRRNTVRLAAISLIIASAARAADDDSAPLPTLDAPSLSFRLDPTAKPDPFGTKGQRWWTLGAGYADDFSDAHDTNLRGAYSIFLEKNIEFTAELNLWYFSQPGRDAVGLNPAFAFRWHFYNKDRWSIYADAGVGLLFASDNVPSGGTGFDFMPRIGLGFTYQLTAESLNRLQLGLRWHHVSNARINGDSRNPARDGAMIYAGIMFPF